MFRRIVLIIAGLGALGVPLFAGVTAASAGVTPGPGGCGCEQHYKPPELLTYRECVEVQQLAYEEETIRVVVEEHGCRVVRYKHVEVPVVHRELECFPVHEQLTSASW
jgi:hypothetical protein